MASTSSKSANPFAHQDTNLDLFQDNYLPRYYEQDIYQNQRITFRSVSPKIYHEKQDYFDSELDELNDDTDALYEQTLLNSDLFAEKKEEDNHALHRLRQILGHMSPNYYQQPATNTIPPSVRSQFSSTTASSSSASTSTTNVMRSFSIPERDPKGKGKFNPSF